MRKYKNTYLIKDDFAVLLITYKEKVAEVLIDKEDISRINEHNWRLNEKGYVISDIKNHKVRLHNLILNRNTSNPKIVCDHINRNKLDNRKSNLKIVSQKENNKNRILKRGKYYTKKKNKWLAYYIVNRKMKSLGYYNSEEEAKEAVKRHFCENQ